MSYSTITEIVSEKVFSLRNTFALDGRVSAYPDAARGYAISNCYLLKEEDGAVLLDTGATILKEQIIGQLATLIDNNTPLSLFPLRINEFMSVGNAMSIAKKFNVVDCYARVPDVHYWLEFESSSASESSCAGPTIPTNSLSGPSNCQVGKSGDRRLQAFSAPIRLISTFWVYDEQTKVLFSSDMFSHIWRENDTGPWEVEVDDDDVSTVSFVQSFLLNTRYWWLEGASLDQLRRNVANVFEQYEIDFIAPAFGAIFCGKKSVENQFCILDEVLRELDSSRVKPYYVPRGMQR